MSEHAITCHRLSKQLGGNQVLSEVSFTVETGDIFGYLGPNGAGKTTTIRILLGLYRRTLGELNILGHTEPGTPELQQLIGFVLDADGLYDNLSALDNLEYYGKLYGLSDPLARAREVVEQVGLADRATERVKVFSTGMRQRLALARAIQHRPRLLILDEPTSGVDPGGQAEVRELIRELASHGTTIFLSSHNLDEVQRTCNRVAFINKGAIRLSGETARLMESPERRVAVSFSSAPPAAALDVLSNLGLNGEPPRDALNFQLRLSDGLTTSEVIRQLVAAGAEVDGVNREQQSLAQLYASVMREEAE